MAGPVAVEGLRDIQRALKTADRDVRLGFRKELRAVAEPVRATAEANAVTRIPTVGVAWSRMRVGVTQNSVYVAPRKRGTKTQSARRPKFKYLLLERAMDPALEQHGPQAEREVEQMLDRVAHKFNRGGL